MRQNILIIIAALIALISFRLFSGHMRNSQAAQAPEEFDISIPVNVTGAY